MVLTYVCPMHKVHISGIYFTSHFNKRPHISAGFLSCSLTPLSRDMSVIAAKTLTPLHLAFFFSVIINY